MNRNYRIISIYNRSSVGHLRLSVKYNSMCFEQNSPSFPSFSCVIGHIYPPPGLYPAFPHMMTLAFFGSSPLIRVPLWKGPSFLSNPSLLPVPFCLPFNSCCQAVVPFKCSFHLGALWAVCFCRPLPPTPGIVCSRCSFIPALLLNLSFPVPFVSFPVIITSFFVSSLCRIRSLNDTEAGLCGRKLPISGMNSYQLRLPWCKKSMCSEIAWS